MSKINGPKIWHPAQFTLGDIEIEKSCAVIILNQPLENRDLLVRFCKRRAQMVVCADGGANRLFELQLQADEENACRPKAIIGDLDSLLLAVEVYYRDSGTAIIRDPDQYTTDLTKCLKYINGWVEEQAREDSGIENGRDWPQIYGPTVAIFGSLGGRADQAFSQLHQLYDANHATLAGLENRLGDIYLITPESIIFLLEKGRNSIVTPVSPRQLNKNVGIIPLGRPSIISTQGLKYDVQDWYTEFGTQVSTSNYIMGSMVQVQTTEPVLFTVGLAGSSDADTSE